MIIILHKNGRYLNYMSKSKILCNGYITGAMKAKKGISDYFNIVTNRDERY